MAYYGMLSRRALIAGFAVAVAQLRPHAAQEKPRDEDLKTVTLIIDGMT